MDCPRIPLFHQEALAHEARNIQTRSKPGPSRREFMQAVRPDWRPPPCAATTESGSRVKTPTGFPCGRSGKTGEMVTMICLGGYHSSVHQNENDSIRLIQRAVDEGITFLDNAWDYHDGAAEERMGKAISPGQPPR